MNYEKKYKEALERARIWQNHLYRTNGSYYANELNYIFPELKESENEKTRKQILSFLKEFEYDHYRNLNFSSWIAWLEKQGNKDSQVKLPTFTFDDILALQCCMETVKKVQNDKDLYEKLNDLHGRIYDVYYLEKQGEQKSIDKFEPKFKVGDWISNDMCDAHIASIEDGMYYFDEGDGLSIVFVDEHYHLWTIQDAKNGDVLTWDDTSCVVLFKNIKNSKCFISYCFANDISFEIGTSHYIEGCHPATKEQRDTLFAKMKEARYTFDFEKKELKEIKQKPAE